MIARRMILALVALGIAARITRADDAVALLPLDAEKGLEIYGQPVAGAIAHALGAGKIDVVVVGAKMDVPENAVLIVDGKIAKGPGGSVILSARVRAKGATAAVEVAPATAPTLTKIDAAAAELSARVLPIVKDKLAALHTLPVEDHGHVIDERVRPEPARSPGVLVAIADWTRAPATDPLRPALEASVAEWVRAQHRDVRAIDQSKLDPKLAARAVADANAELAIGIWILDYHTSAIDTLPIATARAHVRIADGHDVLFDRVVVTDTVLGDPKLPAAGLAGRVAREVLAIVRPHLRRVVRSWH